ncbi:DUF4376 domain-containing protein [Gallibacterium salpingitidis]|uniref:DUF4376 domain-containing protein n=1 Tax=Gallibacterium salpingitidis TaxID=505341 RepID=UPI00266F4D26|nr:DUF4376 domain-containing protein [Gallibacterium salpingitidis]WKT00469.1 DUF4376 domain-containing protein [Gallibacterium salpingitidis]
MQGHNYLLVLDKDGRRVTSYVVGVHGSSMNELLRRAEREFSEHTYLQDPPPNKYQHELTDPNKIYRDGEIIYSPQRLPLIELQKMIWDKIKLIRDKHMYHGGVYLKSVDKWFCTDIQSRQHYILISASRNIPTIQWKTMDNSIIELTTKLLDELLNEILIQDQKNFMNAEYHKNLMLSVDDPSCYDYSSGWSILYEDIS